jgi:hypothetical protein
MPLGVADVLVETLDREPHDRSTISARSGLEMQQMVRLA